MRPGKHPPVEPDPIGLLEAQAVRRIPELVPIRYGRMLVSPFAFYRGAAAIMASDLATLPNTGLQVQLCGDAHLSNFGGFASPERELILDINDFDENAARTLGMGCQAPGGQCRDRRPGTRLRCQERRRSLVLGTVGEYHRAMREFAVMGNLELWYLHLMPGSGAGPLGDVGKTQGYEGVGGRLFPGLPPGQSARLREAHPPGEWPAADRRPPAIGRPDRGHLVGRRTRSVRQKRCTCLSERYRSTLQPDRRRLLESFQYVHMARKVVGVGSVGTRTWIMLLLGRDDRTPCFYRSRRPRHRCLSLTWARALMLIMASAWSRARS